MKTAETRKNFLDKKKDLINKEECALKSTATHSKATYELKNRKKEKETKNRKKEKEIKNISVKQENYIDIVPRVVTMEEFEKSGQYPCDVPYLYGGFRINHFELTDCVKSIFKLHNETLNIWTHLLGCIALIIVMIWYMFYSELSIGFYIKMVNDLKKLTFDESFKIISYSVELFKQNLFNLYEYQGSNVKNTIKSLDSTLNLVLRNKEEIWSFINYIKINNPSEKPELWVSQIGEYHKFVLDINKNLYNLKSYPNLNGNIDYGNMKVFDKIGGAMPNREGIQNLTIWPIILFLACSFFCLSCSVIMHSFNPMNRKIYIITGKIDYSGIIIYIFGAIVSAIYYSYYCDPIKRNILITIQFISCSSLFFIVTTQDWLCDLKYIRVKFCLYGSCGFLACSNVFLALYDGYYAGLNSHALPMHGVFFSVLYMGLTFLMGGLVYVFKFPENYFPNYFVHIHSHVLWHLITIVGMLQQMYILIGIYETRAATNCINTI